jgi:hypothetical protein
VIVTHFWSIEEEKFLPGSEKPSHKYLAKEAKPDFEQYLFAKTCLSCIFALFRVELFSRELRTTCS